MAAQLSNLGEAAFPGSSGAFYSCAGFVRVVTGRLLPVCRTCRHLDGQGERISPTAAPNERGTWVCDFGGGHNLTPALKSATTRATNAATFAAAHSSR